ncbi:hypothetical protein Cgig2_022926 [Carnegiea gigantea]|uniref:Uncharacterized protein n=1 Tax=Carnegiea gigantea TaxID=171969 RepID=A0A9Q1K2M0_9CARY|nr:hypothetical protein Cgig2_022926 [Carnegiea gigantea]
MEEPIEEDLESDSEDKQRMTLGYEDAHGNEGYVIVSKMANVFKQRRLWSRNRDRSVSLKEGDIFICNEDPLIIIKAYCVQQEISLMKRIHALVLVDRSIWMIRRHIGKHNGGRAEANKTYGTAPLKNEEEWSYFLEGLAWALDARENSSNYTIMSDTPKAMGKIKEKEPTTYHWLRDSEPL